LVEDGASAERPPSGIICAQPMPPSRPTAISPVDDTAVREAP